MSSWPASLPQRFLAEGYQEAPADTTIRTSVDYPVDRVRRRFSTAARPISGLLLLTESEVAILDTFYTVELARGALAFDWVHPRTQAAAELRFLSPPVYATDGYDRASGEDLYRVQVQVEVLP